ncbi:MAG: hypothetical protein ACI4JQ_05880, partial [Ruminococcus sp.]
NQKAINLVNGSINIIMGDIDVNTVNWYAGEYWTEAGTSVTVAPYVMNDPGTKGFVIDLETDLLPQLSDADGAIGSAYSGLNTSMLNPEAMKATASVADGSVTAADNSALVELTYKVGDADAIKALAESLGLTLQHDDEHGSYYSFPLTFKDGENEAVDGNEVDITLITENGFINVIVPDDTTTTTTTTTTDTDDTTTTTTTTTDTDDTTTTTTTTTDT